jgi:hypothetical protein
VLWTGLGLDLQNAPLPSQPRVGGFRLPPKHWAAREPTNLLVDSDGASPDNAPRLLYAGQMPKKNTAVRLKQRDLEELEVLAQAEDETVSSLIRRTIREFLDRRKVVEQRTEE